MPEPIHTGKTGWCFSRGEKVGLAIFLCVALVFGANLERRTALRRVPMTDLGVFSCAAWAARSGQNIYEITDWHGWHYQYPPALALFFVPLANPVPQNSVLPADVQHTEDNTPWGYDVASHQRRFGLHGTNARFFFIVAVWFLISVALALFAAHALACTLESASLRDPPPLDPPSRRRWWLLRLLPPVLCIGSIGTEFSRGQVDLLMLAWIAFGLYLAARGRPFQAGIWLSLPATVKLFPPFLLLYPAFRRNWRMGAGMVAGLVLALILLPALTLGPRRTSQLYHAWFKVLAKPALGQGTDTSRAHELTGMNSTDNQSLLAFLHNSKYHALRRLERPAAADASTRVLGYAISLLLFLCIAWLAGLRRHDTPGDLVLIGGLLVALSLVASPIVHNFYYVLMLPLLAALLWETLNTSSDKRWRRNVGFVLGLFMAIDFAARLPAIGPWLRDYGFPLFSVLAVMLTSALSLWRRRKQTGSVLYPNVFRAVP